MSEFPREFNNLPSEEKVRLYPIQGAVDKNNLRALSMLIQSLNPPMSYLHHQLGYAIREKKMTIARCLLGVGVPIDRVILYAATFHTSEKSTSIEIFELLLEYGWDPKEQYLLNPLLCSVMESEDTVKWLLEHGVDPCVGRHEGDPYTEGFRAQSGQVMEQAATWASLETVNRLIEYGARWDLGFPLHYLTWVRDFTPKRRAVMERLMTLGRDINEDDAERGPASRGTPLFGAALFGTIDTIRFLLEHGADPCLKNKWGMTADQEAENYGRPDNAELIRDWQTGVRKAPDSRAPDNKASENVLLAENAPGTISM